MLVSFSVALRITFLLLFLPSGIIVIRHQSSRHLALLHIIVTCLLHEVEILFLDREGFLVVPTSVSSDGNERSLEQLKARYSRLGYRYQSFPRILISGRLQLPIGCPIP